MIRQLLFSLSTVIAIYTQAQDSYVQLGDKCLDRFDYANAIDYYKKAADRDTNDVKAWEKLGNVYLLTDDYKNAEAVYKVLASHSLAKDIDKFLYGQVLRRNVKYEEAGEAYEKFEETSPDDSRAEEFGDFVNALKPCLQDYQLYVLSPFNQNSVSSDLGPSYCAERFVFASNRNSGSVIRHTDIGTSQLYFDLYEMNLTDSVKKRNLKKVKGDVNRKFNEGPATFSKDGKEIIFTQSNYVKIGTDHVFRLGLYHAEYDNKKGWTNVTPLPFNSLTYNVAHPSLSKDGSKLYFSSDMPGSMGESDIYMSEKKDSMWQQPVNLGKAVNTMGREMFPFIDDDGVLYYSSDTRVGLGGLDIYSAYYADSVWKFVSNLGVPVNSAYDDFGYVADHLGKTGFLVSNRMGGMGGDDIYRFTRNENSPFVFPSIYFDSSSYSLTPAAMASLDVVAERLGSNPSLVIELGGNTDARGNEVYNLALSIKRANSCLTYLLGKGVNRERLFIAGYGEQKIINRCTEGVECADEENAMNRRVDFKLIKLF